MNECTSCGTHIPQHELYKTLPDGTIYQEEFCGFCLETYVTNVDSLIVKDYAFENLTGRNDQEIYDFSDTDA